MRIAKPRTIGAVLCFPSRFSLRRLNPVLLVRSAHVPEGRRRRSTNAGAARRTLDHVGPPIRS